MVGGGVEGLRKVGTLQKRINRKPLNPAELLRRFGSKRNSKNDHPAAKNESIKPKLKVKSLSREFFDKNFNQKDSINQGTLGNCYFIAALRSLMNSPNYETLIMNSVKLGLDSDNHLKNIWIQMPLGEPGGERISVENDDFGKQEALVNGKKVIKYGLRGPLGIRALEVAYNEFVMGQDNPDMEKMEGGFSAYAFRNLLGKENVTTFGYMINGGGKGEPAFRNKGDFKFEEANFANKNRQQIFNTLIQYDPNKNILAAGTLSEQGKTDKQTFIVGRRKFYYSHAYTINNVQRNGDDLAIDVINPHDTSKIVTLSFNEFMMVFRRLYGATFTSKFMDNRTLAGTTTVVDAQQRRK